MNPDLLRRGILVTAQALGMDPADLATVISYETGGTFDPMQSGPTTQWGTHRGLIQFGEPQAQEYGADFSTPEAALLSQLGPNGAIVRYFRENGWQPGMGMLDAYSIVNAGGPGRYNASDANNGGAPGTVADKVREQMGGHRQNAAALLGLSGGATRGGNGLASYTPPTTAPAAPPYGPTSTLPMENWSRAGAAPSGNALAGLGPSSAAPVPIPGALGAPQPGNALAGDPTQPAGQGAASSASYALPEGSVSPRNLPSMRDRLAAAALTQAFAARRRPRPLPALNPLV